MNELLGKVLFTTSAGVATVGEEVERGVAQLVSADAFRQQLLDSLKQNAGDTENKSITNEYKSRFNKFAQSADGEAALKKSRLKLLIFAFNALEYTHLIEKTGKDPENKIVRATLLATFLSTVNVASDVMMPAVEHGLKNVALTNSIKWIGSVAGSSASALVLGVDAIGGLTEFEGKRRWQYITLAGGKVIADLGISVKALGWLLGLIEESGVHFAENGLAKRIIGFSAGRIIGFLASWQVMIALFVIEQLVIYFSDDDLQDWCEASVFGEEPEISLTSTEKIELLKVRNDFLKKQENAFTHAVKVIQ
jgi:hypothetical protein